jgi:hypothetical protein
MGLLDIIISHFDYRRDMKLAIPVAKPVALTVAHLPGEVMGDIDILCY